MNAADWFEMGYVSGFASGLVVCIFAVMAVWPDLKRMRTRGKG